LSPSPPAPEPDPPLTLDAIDSGVALVEAKVTPDPKDVLEGEELEAARLRNRLARSQIMNVKADRSMRKQYASRILRYLEYYSVSVCVLVVTNGFHWFGFTLDDKVVATLVGSTAVAAIGLVGFIARGLFRPPS
jgi:hypothetical protein